MAPEERALLEKTYALAQENHEMLTYLRRSQRTQHILRVIYWVLFVLLTIGSSYATVKLLDYGQGAAGVFRDASGGVNQPGGFGVIKNLIDNYNTSTSQ